WPGNIRELKGEVRRCALLAEEGRLEAVEVHHLSQTAGRSLQPSTDRASTPTREVIEAALLAEGGNVSGAARALNIHRNQLRRFISRHGLDAKAWANRGGPRGRGRGRIWIPPPAKAFTEKKRISPPPPPAERGGATTARALRPPG